MKNDEMRSIDQSNGLVAAPGKVYFDHENIAWICTTHGITKLTNEISLFYDQVEDCNSQNSCLPHSSSFYPVPLICSGIEASRHQ